MTPEALRLQWIQTLRTGDYDTPAPGSARLHSGATSFSALGILLDIHIHGDWRYFDYDETLPLTVCELMQIHPAGRLNETCMMPVHGVLQPFRSIVDMDKASVDHKRIANLIERRDDLWQVTQRRRRVISSQLMAPRPQITTNAVAFADRHRYCTE